MGIEHRKYSRRDIELVVNVVAADGGIIRCWLSDISEGGARLATAEAGALPNMFVLELASNLSRWCRVAWRSDQAVGVQFTPAPDVSAVPDAMSKTAVSVATDITRAVMITCKRTGNPISTGVRVGGNNELQRLPETRSFARCPHCGGVHGWEVSDAWIGEDPSPSSGSTGS
jgi:hypothetical protein